MSKKKQMPISIPTNCWDGWRLSPSEQKALINISLAEFEKFPNDRRLPEQLVKQVVGMRFNQMKNKRKL